MAIKVNKTNNGKKGGWLVGKPHYDKNGKPLGGIKAVVTDAGNKPVELEGGEVIINKEASAKHWKTLSKINQSAGGGVPIGPPNSNDEDPEEYKEGGKVIEFNPNHIPNKWILSYAENIKKYHPEIWKLGGNIFGNEAFENLRRVSKRGYWLDNEEWMYIKWRSYVARHKGDFRIEGVVAMLKWVDKVDKGWPYMKNLIEEKIEKIEGKKEKKGWKHKMKTGGEVSKQELEKRWDKKRDGIKTLSNNIQSLRYNLTKDLQSEDEKVFLTALAISLIDATGERVGNEESANNGHFGVTGFEKKHIKINGDTITLNYVGKSGVTHNKSFTDKKLAEGLKTAIKNSNSSLVFCTSDGFNIKADKINRYLQDYNISAKDLRGYLANKLVVYKLDAGIKDENERKKKFNEILKSVAESVGHGRVTLKTHYLLPEIETLYVEKGKVFDIKNYGKGGNLSKTPAPKSERIYGSKTNKPRSAESKQSAKSIKFDEGLISTIKDKIKGTGISLDTAKAVVRRGMGAYSSTHRPTITGGKPNSRTAWGIARLNAFLYKKEHGKSKSGKYVQDDDLMKYGGQILLAPNGEESNLTPEQYKLVRTKEFKDWFGDWENSPETSSKVVDENGEPLVVYRGTRNNTQNVSGFWLTKSKQYAEGFGEVKEYFVKISNPMSEEEFNKTWMVDFTKYDGRLGDFHKIVVKDIIQIKLADGTNTNFDSNNPDIRYADGGELEKGIKTEQEHKKTLEGIASGKYTVDEAIKMTAKDHLKEDPLYYTKLSKIEKPKKNNSFEANNIYTMYAKGGEVELKSGVTAKVGDKGTYTGRLNVDIEIIKITETRVYFKEINTGEQNSKNKENFSKQFVPSTSLTQKQPEVTKPTEPQKTKESAQKQQYSFNIGDKFLKSSLPVENIDYTTYTIDAIVFDEMTKEDRVDISYMLGGEEVITSLPAKMVESYFNLKTWLKLYDNGLLYYPGMYFKSDSWKNNNWAKITRLDYVRRIAYYDFEKEADYEGKMDSFDKLFQTKTYYSIPAPFETEKPVELKQPKQQIPKETNIAKDSSKSFEVWLSNNMINFKKYNTKELSDKIVSQFAMNLKDADKTRGEGVLNKLKSFNNE